MKPMKSKRKRGFARLSPKERREIAKRGAAANINRHRFSSVEAKLAAAKRHHGTVEVTQVVEKDIAPSWQQD